MSVTGTNETPKLLLLYTARALVRVLDTSTTQVDIAAEPYEDYSWPSKTCYLVCPSGSRIDGPGNGAQDGGALLRRQNITVWIYNLVQSLDHYESAAEALTENADGLMDLVEQARALFSYTWFGDSSAGTFLLAGAARFERMEDPKMQDRKKKIVRCGFTFSCLYGELLPRTVSLNLADVTN